MRDNTDTLRIYEQAATAYREQDKSGWRFAVFAALSGGTYKDLADFIGGISADKVENAAHAWQMYRALRKVYGDKIGLIRRLPYVYLSHFSTLYRIQRKYSLPLDAVYSYLMDVYQAEGGISSRDLMLQADRERGIERALPYEADKARSALARVLTRGDLSTPDRKMFVQALARLEELSGLQSRN